MYAISCSSEKCIKYNILFDPQSSVKWRIKEQTLRKIIHVEGIVDYKAWNKSWPLGSKS
jgi:hypothetical protein